jgi:chromosome partitioning protein
VTKRRVLLIDLDPQGNATMGCGVDKHAQSRTSCEVMLGDCAAMEALVPVEYGGFMLMPSNQDLTAAEVRLLGMIAGREFKLRNALKPLREDFDVILIDCPPALNMLTLNALVASDSVMVPMQCEYYALEGLSSLMQTIEQIRTSINPELEIEGCCAPCSTRATTSRTKCPPADRALRRQGVPYPHSAQYSAGRSPKFRQARAVSRQGVARRARLPGARRRDDSPRRAAGRPRIIASCPAKSLPWVVVLRR